MKLSSCNLDFGHVYRDGDFDVLAQCVVQMPSKIITFIDDENYLSLIQTNPSISCIICTNELLKEIPKHIQGIIISEHPRKCFFALHNTLCRESWYINGNEPTTFGEQCNISPLAYIAPNNVRIGNHVLIEEFVSIKEHVTIGDYSVIRAGCIIGSEGYEFKRIKNERIQTINHAGKTVIDSFVELKSMVNIHRAVFPWDTTKIGDGSKIDSMVHIAHGVKLGRNVMVGASAMIAGNTVVGDDAWIGPNASISNRLNIGKEASVSIGSVVTKDIEDGKVVTGNFAIEHERFISNLKKSLL